MSDLISQTYLEGNGREIAVSAHTSGTLGLSVSTRGGDYMRISVHLNRDDAIKLRDMLNGAIENTAAHGRPIDLSNVHPVMAEALAPFVSTTIGESH